MRIKQQLTKILFAGRALVWRFLKPKSMYFMFEPKPKRSLKPLSSKYGYDRGKPIDRFYIEKFLEQNESHIKGRCLEITDNHYTKKYGGHRVTVSDVLDINKKNGEANIKGDLRKLKGKVKSNTYDCIILTHALGEIDNYESAISECRRILRPGGTVLFTSSVFNKINPNQNNYWRFTPASTSFTFKKYFGEANVKVKSYGNVLSGQAFWVGMSQEDLTIDELNFNDKNYPIIVAARATKNK